MADIAKIVAYIVIAVLIIYFIYVFLSCTIPYLIPQKIDEKLKSELDKVDFYGNSMNEAERAVLIEEPKDAYNIRINMVRDTKRTLDISYHNLQVGDTTQAFQGELLKAANRGVKIRLIVDGKIGLGDKAAKDGIRTLEAHSNIEIKGYNPLNIFTPWEIPVVFHDKFIVADNQYLLLGGRNIGDRYFAPKGYDRPVTNDRDVFIWCSGQQSEGHNFDEKNSITQVNEYMNLLWNNDVTDKVWKPFTNSETIKKQEDFLYLKTEKIERENPVFFEKSLEDYKESTVATKKITLVHNPVNTSKKKPTLGYQLKRLALSARNNVTVQTPYATANKNLLSAMKEVSDSSSLTILTNSNASTPNFVAYSNYATQREKFIKTGARIYELQSLDSLHGKSLSMDGRISAVGSFNMDDRSFYIDTETMLIIDSPEFTKMLDGAIKNYTDNSLELESNNKYIDDPSVEEMQVSPIRKIALAAISILSRLFQFQI